MERYAEVILPLPLNATFTYSVPEEMQTSLAKGSRVFVQFGRKKYYTGIISSIHSDAPRNYDVKPIMMILDAESVVRYPQMNFWKWMADYYLCTIGEVYKAAIPSGLKLESETYVTLNPDYEHDEGVTLTQRENIIIDSLATGKRMKISELEQTTGMKSIGVIVSRMLRKGLIEIDEKITDRYKPKKETMVRLTIDRNDSQGLHSCLDALKRSKKGEALLLSYLDLSRWFSKKEPIREVTKKELIERAKVTSAICGALVQKGIFEIYRKEINRFNPGAEETLIKLPNLSENQNKALDDIVRQMQEKNVVLLRGVTGSGKTEIYSRLIGKVLANNEQVLYLVPEISLTTQLTDRLRKIFGNKLIVYHSKFSDNERVDIYRRLLSTHEPLVVLGVRSSVFLPFAKLGLVIVDEEHESSYKQYDPAPRYNARDAAIMLASMHGAKSILGSATPSIETYYKAQTSKYGIVELTERYDGALLPDVEIVDMRDQRKRKLSEGILSEPLRSKTFESLRKGKQTLMFQNRRGFAPIVVCKECGWTPKCINCDVSLVFHKNINRLTCHYCGYGQDLPPLCPACGNNSIDTFGYGTERIAEELDTVFDGFRIARMDLDTTRNKNAYQQIIEDFSEGKTHILIGTQMVSKGLDFERVSLSGILNADTLLNFPDFRSDERAFNMLEQVAGRAGRRKDKGDVIIQTNNPDNEVLRFVASHDYVGFYNKEIQQRKKLFYPPFSKVIVVYLKNKDKDMADFIAKEYTDALKKVFGNRVIGPQPPVISRISNYYIRTIMLKIESNASMKKVKDLLLRVYASLSSDRRLKSSVIYYDVDPV